MYKILLIIVLVLGFIFYWYELKPKSEKQACYKSAMIKKEESMKADRVYELSGGTRQRADYEKVFKDEFDNCLGMKGY
ncbi:MAG: hypothetical protein AAB681_02400 [Patescibacteria group bacterium]